MKVADIHQQQFGPSSTCSASPVPGTRHPPVRVAPCQAGDVSRLRRRAGLRTADAVAGPRPRQAGVFADVGSPSCPTSAGGWSRPTRARDNWSAMQQPRPRWSQGHLYARQEKIPNHRFRLPWTWPGLSRWRCQYGRETPGLPAAPQPLSPLRCQTLSHLETRPARRARAEPRPPVRRAGGAAHLAVPEPHDIVRCAATTSTR